MAVVVPKLQRVTRHADEGAAAHQWQVGLGKYAYETKGYRKIATVGEDYSFIYTQVFGLVLEFCGAGGQVTAALDAGQARLTQALARQAPELNVLWQGQPAPRRRR